MKVTDEEKPWAVFHSFVYSIVTDISGGTVICKGVIGDRKIHEYFGIKTWAHQDN